MKPDFVITKGVVHGRCPKCGEAYMGEFDADETTVDVKCVGCGKEGFYRYTWPEDLPKFNLRPRRRKDKR